MRLSNHIARVAAAINVDTSEFTTEDSATALTLDPVWGNGVGTVYAAGGRSSIRPYQGIALARTLEQQHS